jgi:acetyltransferase
VAEQSDQDRELRRCRARPYTFDLCLRDGSAAQIRPIRPEDEPLMVRFHESLSASSVYFRYFGTLKLEQRVSHERLARVCFTDFDREIALVLDRPNPASGEHEILGVVRLARTFPGTGAEFAIVLSDRWQRQGLGRELTRRLLEVARAENIRHIVAYILPDNREMLRLAEHFGFSLDCSTPGEVVAELDLAPA